MDSQHVREQQNIIQQHITTNNAANHPRKEGSLGGVAPIQEGAILPIVGESSPAEEYSVDQHLHQPPPVALVAATLVGTPSAAATSLLQSSPMLFEGGQRMSNDSNVVLDGQRRVSNADVLGLIGSSGGGGGNVVNSPRTPSTSLHRLDHSEGSPNQHMAMMMLLGLPNNSNAAGGSLNTSQQQATAGNTSAAPVNVLASSQLSNNPSATVSNQVTFMTSHHPNQQQALENLKNAHAAMAANGRPPRERSVGYSRDAGSPPPAAASVINPQTVLVMMNDGTFKAYIPSEDTMGGSNPGPNATSNYRLQQPQNTIMLPAVGYANNFVHYDGLAMPSRRDMDNVSTASSSIPALPVPRSPRGASSYISNIANNTSGPPMMISATTPATYQPQGEFGGYFGSPVTSGGVAASPSTIASPNTSMQQQLPPDAAIYFSARRPSVQNQLSYIANASVQQHSEVAVRGSPAPQPSRSHFDGGASQFGSYYQPMTSAGGILTNFPGGNHSYSRAQRELSFFGSTGPEASHMAAAGGDSNEVSVDRAYSGIMPVLGFGANGGLQGVNAMEAHSNVHAPHHHVDPFGGTTTNASSPSHHASSHQQQQMQMSTATTTTSHATVSTAPPTQSRIATSQHAPYNLGGVVLSPTSANILQAPDPMGTTGSSHATNFNEFHHHVPTYPSIVGHQPIDMTTANRVGADGGSAMQQPQRGATLSPAPAATGPQSSNNASTTTAAAGTKPVVLFKKIDASGKNLFVSGLHPCVDHKRLKSIFLPYGAVNSTRVLYDTADPTRSKGMGFVHYEEHSSVDLAIRALNGVRISLDIPSSELPNRGSPNTSEGNVQNPNGSQTAASLPGEGGAQKPSEATTTVMMTLQVKLADDDATFIPEETNKLFIRNVPRCVSTMQLWTYFRRFGNVLDCSIHKDISARGKLEHSTLNMAYVTYSSIPEANRAMDITNNTIPWSNERYFNVPESVEGTTAAERAAAQLANGPSAATGHFNSLFFGENNGSLATTESQTSNVQRRNGVRSAALANLRATLKASGRVLKQGPGSVVKSTLSPDTEGKLGSTTESIQSGSPIRLSATAKEGGIPLKEVTLSELSIEELFMLYDPLDDEDGEDAVVRQLSDSICALFVSGDDEDHALQQLNRLARSFPTATRTVPVSHVGSPNGTRGRGGGGHGGTTTITIRPLIVKPAETLLCRTMRMQKLQQKGPASHHANQQPNGNFGNPAYTSNGVQGGGRGGYGRGGNNFLPQVPNYPYQPPTQQQLHQHHQAHVPYQQGAGQQPTMVPSPFMHQPGHATYYTPAPSVPHPHQMSHVDAANRNFAPLPVNSSQLGNSLNPSNSASSETHSHQQRFNTQHPAGVFYPVDHQQHSMPPYHPTPPQAAGMSPLTPSGPSYEGLSMGGGNYLRPSRGGGGAHPSSMQVFGVNNAHNNQSYPFSTEQTPQFMGQSQHQGRNAMGGNRGPPQQPQSYLGSQQLPQQQMPYGGRGYGHMAGGGRGGMQHHHAYMNYN